MPDQNIEWTKKFVAWFEEGATQAEIKRILAEHHKMIVKKIRGEIKKQYKETRERFAEGKMGNERVNAMVNTILSPPSLSNV